MGGLTEGSTLTGIEQRESPAAVWGRRGALAALAVFVVLGLLGVLGVHATTATADGDGFRVSLRYASIARSGLDVPWTLTVTADQGLDKEVTLAVTGDYFDIYETQGFHPDASASYRDADTLYLTFDTPPDGNTMVVTYDAYIQPASQQGRSGTVGVLAEGGRVVAAVDFRTRLLP
ncbi:MAG: hypothetical protein ABIO16_05610 [Nocardioides sp.]